MTYINEMKNSEIDYLDYSDNEIKNAILNNNPIEDNLHVIIVVSNPCFYKSRYILAKEFINRIYSQETNVLLYVVELTYKNQPYVLTEPTNPRHLRINTDMPIWHKESLINVGVEKLLPVDWKAFAWIDADIEFENSTWALDTLKVLNGCKDIVQLFSHCVDMDYNQTTMNVFNSFGYQYNKKLPYSGMGLNLWHSGYAWACNRFAYEKMQGLYDKGILGSGDMIMALSLINNVEKMQNPAYSEGYRKSMSEFQKNVKSLRFGYVPGVIRHHYHGSKKNRHYNDRWKILVNYNYDPYIHVSYDNNNLLIPSINCPIKLLIEIFEYFESRNEDERFQ